MATQDVEILQVNTAPSVQSIAGLRKEIKALKGELLGLEQGTEEYNQKLVEVADKTHQLAEVTRQVNATSTDFGDRMANLRGTIAGTAGAFQTVLGSLSLMGVEMGDDVKMLKMLQSAMAITQGVSAIDSGVKAFKALTISIKASTAAMSGLKKAMLTSGIAAVAVAVGILVSKLIEMKEASDEAVESARLGFAALKGEITKTDRELQRLLKRMKAEGASEEELYNKQLEALQAKEQKLTEFIQRNSRAMYDTKVGSKERKAYEELIADALEQRKDINEQIKDLENDFYVDSLNRQNEAAKKSNAALKAALEKDMLARQEAYKLKPTDMSGMELPEAQQGNAEAEQQLIELQALTDYYVRKAEITIANEKDIDEQLLQLDMQYRDRREELLRTRLEDGLITQQEFDNQMAQLEIEAAELQIELEEQVTERTQEQLEKRKELHLHYVAAIKSVAGSVQSILGSVGDTLEQGTREWKALKIAEATIETIAGGITAYMTTFKEVGGGVQGLIAGAAAAAAVLATGYAEIAKIRAVEVSKNGSSGGGSLGSVSTSAVSVNAMNVTPTRAIQTDEDIANLPDTRVYVTEQDITNAQRRVRVTNENATY